MIPKAELHVHLEGTAPPDRIRRLAARNRLALPDGLFDGAERFAYTYFLDFLRAYDRAASVIRTGDDYRDIAYEYLAAAHERGRSMRLARLPQRRGAPPTGMKPAATRAVSRTRSASKAVRRRVRRRAVELGGHTLAWPEAVELLALAAQLGADVVSGSAMSAARHSSRNGARAPSL